jgi:hypothetical protein
VVALAAITWLACSGDAPPTPPAMPEGWPDLLAGDPGALEALVADDAEGWVALHRGDAPAGPSDRPAGMRARAEDARVEAALDGATTVAWARLLAAWEAGPGLPEGSALPALAGLAAGGAPPAVPPAVAACAAAHASAVSVDDIGRAACPTPLVSEADGARIFPDPLVHRTRARLGMGADAGLDGLPAIIFSGAWSGADRAADGGVRLDGPTMAALGIDLSTSATDDADRARASAAALERAMQSWQDARADAPGATDVAELSLLAVYRSGLLAASARAHLDAGQPHAATALLQRARDLQAPRVLGPANRPEVLALTAWAALATGRTREALDALAPLRRDRAHVAGLVSAVEDLAVLEGMRRTGDSRER